MRERQNTKQAPGSKLSAQSLPWGLNPQTAGSWPELKSDAQLTEPPRCPSKALNVCLQQPTTRQMMPLKLEYQKGNGENNWLKNSEPKVATCEYYADSTKNVMTCEYHTEDQHTHTYTHTHKISKWDFRAVSGTGANVLNFDHISQLRDTDRSGRIV